MKTPVGVEAVLPCSTSQTGVDYTDLIAHWKRPDLPKDHQTVYFRRNGGEVTDEQIISYRGRTSLFEDDVKKGNMSLKLSNVTSSDHGNYTCVISGDPNETNVQLTVGKTILLSIYVR